MLANLFVVPIFIRLPRQGDAVALTRFGYLISVAALLLSRFFSTVIFAAAPMMIVTSAFTIWQYRAGRQLPLLARGFFLSILGIGCAATALFIILFRKSMESWPEEYLRRTHSLILAVTALIVIAIILVRRMQTERKKQWIDRLLPWLAAALLPLALLGWDQRTPWTRFVESSGPVPASLAALLPPHASVYWEGGIRMLWLRLQRPSYFSGLQGSGTMFFRGTAIAYQHRLEGFWPLHTLDFSQVLLSPPLDKKTQPERTRADLEEACRREPALDDLVLTRPVADVTAKIWDSPVPYQDVRVVNGKLIVHDTSRFYIYSCAAVR